MAGKLRGLLLDRGTWWVKRRVPVDVKEIVGKEFFKVSLATDSLSEAERRYPAAMAKIEAEIAAAREAADPFDRAKEASRLRLDPEEKRRRFEKLRDALPDWKADWYARTGRFAPTKHIAVLPEAELKARIEDALETLQFTEEFFPDMAGHYPLHEYATIKPTESYGSIVEQQIKRAIPHVLTPAPAQPYLALAGYKKPAISLTDLIDRYNRDSKKAARTDAVLRGEAQAFAVLMEVLGPHTPLDQIDRDAIRRFVHVYSYLPSNPAQHAGWQGSFVKLSESMEPRIEDADPEDLGLIRTSTLNKYLTMASTLFEWAEAERLIDHSPAKKIRVPSGDTDRRAFTVEELQKLFNADYRADGNNFIPLIALFQGMRANEIAQLRPEDIVYDQNVACIRLTVDTKADFRSKQTEPNRRTLKNKAAERDLPIHRRLLELGFLEFVDRRRSNGAEHLFLIRDWKSGSRWDTIREDIYAMFEAAGIRTKQTPFHSLRHNFDQALRNDNICGEHRRALGGWSEGRSAELEYGRGFGPNHLKESIDKIDWPLNLRHPDL